MEVVVNQNETLSQSFIDIMTEYFSNLFIEEKIKKIKQENKGD